MRHQLFGYRLAGHHSDALAAFGAQRAEAGIDLVGDFEQAGRPFGDDDAGRRELGATCRPDGQSHPDLGLHRCEPP
ncbi:Uncharacterised protein [Mycobacterium tuberculosis]|uniref:Uncharacterized protein n=1 Tax=Mycobacterium tuberculosis TaxID=1773 RepID=A0A654TI23_MYCTX|nr:Uncharacterised protein [Mycobacterium tuberculosis]CFE47776.1 Uncharacterised protein [Mycobacterium tuberculosis]CFE82973.1 Uncharacterised protein [Mycobacterium tuberculosis]CFR76575.1 Uncharacterised protein [Mycobacterium tuberculosis]CFR84437.1 Uncharacterised protein [Mycobacterium tuberculosis]